ncbi:unnamed protein product [Caenorhabditis angaria]|uniref:FBA domain-containing protein n=1 Tax=Caenorhabditis angaria TaxID=860376 RepID=A0A9P1IQU2_9PELO|nr:unnamed protein product [Caenorhabditis angaria]
MTSILEPYDIELGKPVDYHANKYNIKFIVCGSGISIEKDGFACEADPNIPACFAFSNNKCSIQTIIDLREQLKECDWDNQIVRPEIRIIQKVNHRVDCASEIELIAQLSKTPDQPEIHEKVQKSWGHWERPAVWEDLVIVLDDYSAGMRFLRILVSGKDSSNWAGYFGPKVGKLRIEVKYGKIRELEYHNSKLRKNNLELTKENEQMKNDLEKFTEYEENLIVVLDKLKMQSADVRDNIKNEFRNMDFRSKIDELGRIIEEKQVKNESRSIIKRPNVRRIQRKYEKILKTDIHQLFFKLQSNIDKMLDIQANSTEIIKIKIECLEYEEKIEEYLRRVNEEYWKIARNPDIFMDELGKKIETIPSNAFMEKYRKLMKEHNLQV